MGTPSSCKSSFLNLSEEAFAAKLKASSAWKERSHRTLIDIHWPELSSRLGLNFELPECSPSFRQASDTRDGRLALQPDLSNTRKIEIIYLGNSMLERLKTTGISTNLGRLAKEGTAWNAGCGGDKNENINYRLCDDGHGLMHLPLESFGNVNLWVLVSGTNNLRPKKPFRTCDVESYRLLLEACVRIAPKSKIIACDMLYRKDIPDDIVDESNNMLKAVVQETNRAVSGHLGAAEQGLAGEPIQWLEARTMIGKELLVDHVHLTEEGYAKWDQLIWPYVRYYMQNFKETNGVE